MTGPARDSGTVTDTGPVGDTGTAADPFEHIGLFYRDEDEYATACAGFVDEALSRGDPAMVAVPGDNGDLIRTRLGSRAAGVRFADMAVAGRNPGRIIPSVLLAFACSHPGRRVWIIGEPIWKGRSGIEYPACAAHEALINTVFTGREAAILCPYDASRLDARVIADAGRTHPLVGDVSGTWASPDYADPIQTAREFDWPLPEPPGNAALYAFTGIGSLPAVRAFVSVRAMAEGLGEQRVADLLLVATELATNTAEYTSEPGLLTVWAEHGTLVCQFDDFGRIADPLFGRVPPPDAATRGRGMVIVNELADLVRVHHRPSGTTVRLHFDLPAAGSGS
jgi:anti-sigma regulatory factor (Ser/Thr protein kinase)